MIGLEVGSEMDEVSFIGEAVTYRHERPSSITVDGQAVLKASDILFLLSVFFFVRLLDGTNVVAEG